MWFFDVAEYSEHVIIEVRIFFFLRYKAVFIRKEKKNRNHRLHASVRLLLPPVRATVCGTRPFCTFEMCRCPRHIWRRVVVCTSAIGAQRGKGLARGFRVFVYEILTNFPLVRPNSSRDARRIPHSPFILIIFFANIIRAMRIAARALLLLV